MNINQAKDFFPLFANDDVNLSHPDDRLSSVGEKETINGKGVSSGVAILNTAIYSVPGYICGSMIGYCFYQALVHMFGWFGYLLLYRPILGIVYGTLMGLITCRAIFKYLSFWICFYVGNSEYPLIERFLPFKTTFVRRTRVAILIINLLIFVICSSVMERKRTLLYRLLGPNKNIVGFHLIFTIMPIVLCFI
ncbi:hypothetical protein NEDG_02184 [Nematocida displodere]|uniref:Uncharacterized protein n=1 Tax=Nematocida displodere TaxID=1805483 RepID=A0A177EG69_9MICR|nr:hypothetical protein NEDG_02184 [Nematocida displodere]